MKITRIIMGMPVTIEVVDSGVTTQNLDSVFAYFEYSAPTSLTVKYP